MRDHSPGDLGRSGIFRFDLRHRQTHGPIPHPGRGAARARRPDHRQEWTMSIPATAGPRSSGGCGRAPIRSSASSNRPCCSPRRASPLTPDERALYLADYSRGILRIDLVTERQPSSRAAPTCSPSASTVSTSWEAASSASRTAWSRIGSFASHSVRGRQPDRLGGPRAAPSGATRSRRSGSWSEAISSTSPTANGNASVKPPRSPIPASYSARRFSDSGFDTPPRRI